MRKFIYLLIGLVTGSALGAAYGGDVLASMAPAENLEVGDAPYQNLREANSMPWPSELPVPELAVDLQKDPSSGHNLILTADGFVMTPEDTNGPVEAGTGHGHMFVNGVNVGRLYGNYHHFNNLPEGDVTIHIYLGGNDHRIWVANGEPLFVERTFQVE
ncbi:hypothetical protein [Yoonia litorea]|uniref:Uncharacterized protein n=1 Tax=Yoonia litorea TaxID=1123755 RepID=A0A1I6N0P1_9RHOB|nr:hypothetical protein [Yoonia litorea]SFS21421.1 hypothetical protein SAMN05444714_2825 [Yoonia litorea]